MVCSICFDDVDKVNEMEIIFCENHNLHAECFSLWICANKAVPGIESVCPVCSRQLGETEQKKIEAFSEKYFTTLVEYS